ncbi:MAG: APH(3') family aminoglycoside O-phosphotransferase [Gemmatimonadaceae bacterium]
MPDFETDSPRRELPPEVARLLAGARAREIPTGMSGARVRRYEWHGASPAMFLKTAPVAPAVAGERLSDEVARLRWMAAHALPVSHVHHYEVADGVEYLLLGEVHGADASAARDGRAAPAVVAALADGLRLLHATPAADCPFRHDASSRIEDARERVRAGRVDADDFDAERLGRGAEELLEELIAARPTSEGAVFTHGDYCLPNVILRGDAREGVGGVSLALSGFVDCGRAGVADPYQDLALAARSLAYNLGADWVPLLFERYEFAELDRSRLHFYTLLDEFF